MKLRYMGETSEPYGFFNGKVYPAKRVHQSDCPDAKAYKVSGSVVNGRVISFIVYAYDDGSCCTPGVQCTRPFEKVEKSHLKMLVRAFRRIGKKWRDSKKSHTTWSHKSVKREWHSEINWAQCQALMYVGSDGRITDDYIELIELEPGQKLTQHDVDAIVAEDMSNW